MIPELWIDTIDIEGKTYYIFAEDDMQRIKETLLKCLEIMEEYMNGN